MTVVNMSFPVEMDLEQLSGAITSNFSRDEVFELIKGLDAGIAEYEFTQDLRDHFSEELRKEDEGDPDE